MKRWALIFLICALLLPFAGQAQGCAVCTKTATELGANGARGLNGGILYLAFLPITILSTLGYLWWRGGRPH